MSLALKRPVSKAEGREGGVVEFRGEYVGQRGFQVGLAEHHVRQEPGQQGLVGGGFGALGADGFPDQVVGDDTCRIHCFSKWFDDCRNGNTKATCSHSHRTGSTFRFRLTGRLVA